MSVRKKKTEIRRLITAFEREADKFHDLSFSIFYVSNDGITDSRAFSSPNHSIMLWQYYGKIEPENGANELLQDLKDSDFKWGIRGAKLSAFAVLEGESCNLFCRMAKRAASLFNEKESSAVKSRLVDEIIESEKDDISIQTAAVNSNGIAIWLNFLLYYVSKVNPSRGKEKAIEPDPFALSLLALEDLLENPKTEKVDKSFSKVSEINFKVALSFPGEHRTYVSKVTDILRGVLGKDQVFYDYDYQSQLASPNLDTTLQEIYRNNSDLIVVFLCKEYAEKEWCGLEWRAVRDIIKSRDNDKVMFIRFDNEKIDGIFSIDGFIDANIFSEEKVAEFIMERIQLSSDAST